MKSSLKVIGILVLLVVVGLAIETGMIGAIRLFFAGA